MKLKNIITSTLVTLTLFSSCTDGFESENTDPNRPVKVPTYGIFNQGTKQVVNFPRGAFGSARTTLAWVNYSAQFAYTEDDRYQVRPTTPASLFDTYYYQANNFRNIIKFCEDGSALQYGSVANQLSASRIMLSYIFLNLVDTFGDVPYYSYGNPDPDFQALDINNVAPKFATQEKIYADILNELKEAANSIDLTENYIFKTGNTTNLENTFNNNPLKLKKFANSLRLRVANRVKGYAPLSTIANQHIADLVANPSELMTSNNDSVGVTFEDNSTNPAPQYTAFFLGDNRTDYTASNQFLELLKGNVTGSGIDSSNPDPRIFEIVMKRGVPISRAKDADFPRSTNLNDYVGMPFGLNVEEAGIEVETVTAGFSFFSNKVLKPNYTEYYMEYAEVEFLLSENNSWNQQNYINGVRASLDKWGVPTTDADTYINALPGANQTNVMTQKYIALFMQPYEAWAEYRRTGFPEFIVKPGDQVTLVSNPQETTIFTALQPSYGPNLTDLPRRIQYPFQQQTLNGNNYREAATRIGGDFMATKLIFDKNY